MTHKTMWKCYHCKKDIAPKAPTCPHCGGTFNAYSRGFMSSNARAADDWERKKAGLEPKGCLGAFVGLISIGLFLAATTTYVLANEKRPDIAGMATGATLQQLTAELPKEVRSVPARRKKLDVTYFAATSKANMYMSFEGIVEWRFRKPNYDHVVTANLDPMGIVTSIERVIGYESGASKPPLLDGVIEGLHQKYGQPQEVQRHHNGSQKLHWWIKTGAAKSNNIHPSKICPARVARMNDGLEWLKGVKSAEGLDNFVRHFGEIGADCGFIIRADIVGNGSLLRSLKVKLIDVQQVHKTMRDTHFLLRNKSIEAEIKLQANSGAVPEL